jgi:hypothetical protein
MKTLVVLLAISGAAQAADTSALPPEVKSHIEDRELCEHFRQKPFEGSTPEQVERREFLQESVEIHCAGTDRRLAALKKRYIGNRAVLSRLDGCPDWLETDCLLGQFAKMHTAARRRYAEFVAQGKGLSPPWPAVNTTIGE